MSTDTSDQVQPQVIPLQLPVQVPRQEYRRAQSNIPDEKSVRVRLKEITEAHDREWQALVKTLYEASNKEHLQNRQRICTCVNSLYTFWEDTLHLNPYLLQVRVPLYQKQLSFFQKLTLLASELKDSIVVGFFQSYHSLRAGVGSVVR